MSSIDAQEKLADDIAKTGEKRGVDEILGMDTEAMSVKQIRKLLVNKGVLPKAKGGKVTSEFRNGGRVNISNFKGQF